MTDEENLKLIEQVHKLLDQSDYDYVLLGARKAKPPLLSSMLWPRKPLPAACGIFRCLPAEI